MEDFREVWHLDYAKIAVNNPLSKNSSPVTSDRCERTISTTFRRNALSLFQTCGQRLYPSASSVGFVDHLACPGRVRWNLMGSHVFVRSTPCATAQDLSEPRFMSFWKLLEVLRVCSMSFSMSFTRRIKSRFTGYSSQLPTKGRANTKCGTAQPKCT